MNNNKTWLALEHIVGANALNQAWGVSICGVERLVSWDKRVFIANRYNCDDQLFDGEMDISNIPIDSGDVIAEQVALSYLKIYGLIRPASQNARCDTGVIQVRRTRF